MDKEVTEQKRTLSEFPNSFAIDIDRSMTQCCDVSPIQRQPGDHESFPCNQPPVYTGYRSWGDSTVEHLYASLDNSLNCKIQSDETSALLHNNGQIQVVPNTPERRCNSLDILATSDTNTLRSDASSGYCKTTTYPGQNMFGSLNNITANFYKKGFYITPGRHCNSLDILDKSDKNTLRSDASSGYCKTTKCPGQNMVGGLNNITANFYKKGFYILILVNILVLLIFVVGLPVVYFSAKNVEPESRQRCLEYAEAQTILRGPYANVLVPNPKSGKLCVNVNEMLQQVANQSFKGVTWEGRNSCGLTVSADNTAIEVSQNGWYFIFSRIHFSIDNQAGVQQFPVGFKLYKNKDSIDGVTQTCSAGKGLMRHTSILESIHFLNKGDTISVEIEAESSQLANVSKHKLGYGDIWVDGTYQANTWLFTNGTSVPIDMPTEDMFWASGEPDSPSTQSCIRLRHWSGFKFASIQCDNLYSYMCEIV